MISIPNLIFQASQVFVRDARSNTVNLIKSYSSLSLIEAVISSSCITEVENFIRTFQRSKTNTRHNILAVHESCNRTCKVSCIRVKRQIKCTCVAGLSVTRNDTKIITRLNTFSTIKKNTQICISKNGSVCTESIIAAS